MKSLKEFECVVKVNPTTTGKAWVDLLEDGSYYFKSVNIHPFEESVIADMKKEGFVKSFTVQENENKPKTYFIDGEEFELDSSSWKCNNEYTYILEKIK